MEKEIIKIEPKLGGIQYDDFLNFCKRIKKAIARKEIDARQLFLVREKEEINGVYSGKGFHRNTDLAFLKNLILDLLLQDWDLVIRNNKIQIELETLETDDKNANDEKAKTRRRHLLARNVQLKVGSVAEFIKSMERRKLTEKGWQSIFSVMRDGSELREKLNYVAALDNEEAKLTALSSIVKPYIQIVEPDLKCPETGLKLSDIWRYFRHTWVNEYKSLPGRSISILVRDAAVPGHPVIGIAALGSSVAQQTCRDKWIGWEGETFIEKLKTQPSAQYGKWIIETLKSLPVSVTFISPLIIALSTSIPDVNCRCLKPLSNLITNKSALIDSLSLALITGKIAARASTLKTLGSVT